jgi:GT2 family glycosyltransferase
MKVHYIQPYNILKNIGKGINDAINQINADRNDFIVLLDHDVCFLRADSKRQLEEILNTTDYDILGPVTNRLSMPHQLANGMFDVTDMREHIKAANAYHEANYGQVIPTKDILAAFCLCFRVSTWEKVGGFQQNSIQFDSIFCASAMNSGAKCGIMVGVYVFHCYRLLSDNPKYSFQHLLPEPPPQAD